MKSVQLFFIKATAYQVLSIDSHMGPLLVLVFFLNTKTDQVWNKHMLGINFRDLRDTRDAPLDRQVGYPYLLICTVCFSTSPISLPGNITEKCGHAVVGFMKALIRLSLCNP